MRIDTKPSFEFIHLYGKDDNVISFSRTDWSLFVDYVQMFVYGDKPEGALMIINGLAQDIVAAPIHNSKLMVIALYKTTNNYVVLSCNDMDTVLKVEIPPYREASQRL